MTRISMKGGEAYLGPIKRADSLDPKTNTISDYETLGCIAVIEDSAKMQRTWHYDELAEMITQLAVGLHNLRLPRGTRIGIASLNIVDFLIAYFALLRSGLVVVPLNFQLALSALQHMIDDACIDFILVDEEAEARMPTGVRMVRFGSERWLEWLASKLVKLSPPSLLDEAMVMYTSGSTGQPKGVPINHMGLKWIIDKRITAQGYAPKETLLVAAPMYHSNGLGNCIFALALGAQLVLQPRFDANSFVRAILQNQVSYITGVPAMLAMALTQLECQLPHALSCVRTVRLASAPFGAALRQRLADIFKGTSIINAYGTTESGLVPFGPGPSNQHIPPLSLGWLSADVQVRLVDKNGNNADEGVLWIKTPATMKGYLNLPELSKLVLDSNGLYCTGDRMRRGVDGEYYFLLRDDDMFVCGGENIYPNEVEQLLEQHPAVEQACVVPVDDEIKGQKPFAFVILHAGVSATPEDLRKFALEHAPVYRHPRHVILLKKFPTTGSEKVNRIALRQLAEVELARIKLSLNSNHNKT